MRPSTWLLAGALLALLPSLANAQAVLSERTISYGAAMDMAAAALESCRKGGYRVTVTVLNRAGRTKVVLHDDGAGPHTLENSLRKAYTSLTFRVPSGEYGKRLAANPPPHPALLLDKVTSAEGAFADHVQQGGDRRHRHFRRAGRAPRRCLRAGRHR